MTNLELKNILHKCPLVGVVVVKIWHILMIFLPTRSTWEDIVYVLIGWIPGSLGFLVRSFIWSFFCKKIGKNVKIFPDVRLMGTKNIEISDKVTLWVGTKLIAYGGKLFVGERTYVTGAMISASGSSIKIGSHGAFAPGVVMRSANHTYADPTIVIMDQPHTDEPIEIGNDVWIGASATILPGAVIGDGCVIGAGSVVVRGEILPNSIAVGVPARVKKKRS